MVELWVRFDKADAAIMEDLYLDIMMLTGEPMVSRLAAANLPEPMKLIGFSEEENAVFNEAAPPEFQKPWSPELSPWFDPTLGLEICNCLRSHIEKTPERFQNWPDMAQDILKILDEFETGMQRAIKHGAKFQTFCGPF